MLIRPATTADLLLLADIDGTIESTQYLHIERTGDALGLTWRIEQRPLREKLILANPIDDETRFALRQITTGSDEGFAPVVEHDDAIIGSLVARPHPATSAFRILDFRVDYDHRRQGIAFALLCQAIQEARSRQLRAVSVRTLTNNLPAANLLLKLGFDITGLDTHRLSNHDLVKEAVSLFWHAALD